MFFLYLNVAVFLVFALSYWQDRRKIINGFLFNCFLFSVFITLLYFSFTTYNRVLVMISLVFLVILGLIGVFGAFALMVASFVNARILIKKEGARFSNFLTLFLGLAILGLLVLSSTILANYLPEFMKDITGFLILLFLYFLFNFMNFFIASFIYQVYRPRLNKDFIIVLGSGLIDGYIVPPLLQNRINVAMNFYFKQAKAHTPPKLLFSGGQGGDEKIPEAVAMQQYALKNGIPLEDTLLEDQSVNTLENMVFSKKIMDSLKGDNQYKSLFATNNFHLFRAGIYAKRAGLTSQGIGSKTAFYYWPNAMIREFIAILALYKKWHLAVIIVMALITIALSIIGYFFT